MKFFSPQKNNLIIVNLFKKNKNQIKFIKDLLPTEQSISEFSNFFLKNGFLVKSKILFSSVLFNFNNFILQKNNFIFENYPNSKWILSNILEKKHNFSYVFGLVTNLVKPPFVIKSVLVPKKIRKKTKKKYLIKIIYKNENKRLKSAYKQLYYYSNKFNDGNFNVRLYKAFMFSFLDWKNSYLFKLKSMVFKKFFKF